MTERAAIVARIADRIQFLTGAAPDTIEFHKPLLGQAYIDSLDLVGIAFAVEEEFGVSYDDFPSVEHWTVELIADAVIAARTL